MDKNKGTRWISFVNILAGLWLIISPFLFGFTMLSAIWNTVIVGLVVGVLALLRFIVHTTQTSWMSWVNGVLGLWLIIAPSILRYGVGIAPGDSYILGLIVAIFGFWSALSHPSAEMATR